jgi:hypothetical protein
MLPPDAFCVVSIAFAFVYVAMSHNEPLPRTAEGAAHVLTVIYLAFKE